MKVTGETFSFMQKEKRSRRCKILKVSKLSGKRTEQESNLIIFLFCPFIFINKIRKNRKICLFGIGYVKC
jgi:hypothetical protein